MESCAQIAIVAFYLTHRTWRYIICAVPEIAPFFCFEFSGTSMIHKPLGRALESRQNPLYLIRMEYMCLCLENVLWKPTISSHFTPASIPSRTVLLPGFTCRWLHDATPDVGTVRERLLPAGLRLLLRASLPHCSLRAKLWRKPESSWIGGA